MIEYVLGRRSSVDEIISTKLESFFIQVKIFGHGKRVRMKIRVAVVLDCFLGMDIFVSDVEKQWQWDLSGRIEIVVTGYSHTVRICAMREIF